MRPCNKYIRFGVDLQAYHKNWQSLCPPRPEHCVQCGLARPLVKHTLYWRTVIDATATVRIAIHRFRCQHCGKTVSFLPAFAVPHKQYSSAVIGFYLYALLVVGESIHGLFNRTLEVARSTIQSWARQWRGNHSALAHEGFRRLNLIFRPHRFAGDRRSLFINAESVGVFVGLCTVVFGATLPTTLSLNNALFAQLQPLLSADFPPLGLFRPTLMPPPS